MPLQKIHELGSESQWGLWLVEESEELLAYEALESAPEEIVSPQKRLEYLAGRALIKKLVEKNGFEYDGLFKDEFGKPYLKELAHQISLSHSYPYVAAQIHPNTAVGIDVEQPKEKLLRIGSRVLSPTELADAGSDPIKHCVYWCAKEALYKIHGKKGLHFNHQLTLEPFSLAPSGRLVGHILLEELNTRATLGYEVNPEFVLVYTIP
jgi:phosphopantetheinyl transferase